MESNTILKASEARSKAEERALTLEKVMANIDSMANDGREEAVFIGMIIPDKLKTELFNLGYSLRMTKAHFGENLFIVSW